MYIAITILVISISSIILMIFLKQKELKTSNPSIFLKIGKKTDSIFRSIYRRIIRFFSYWNRKTAIALAQWLAFHILNSGKNILSWLHDLAHLHPHTKKVIDMVKGKEGIGKRGSASIYLKRLKEESKYGERGVIEDIMIDGSMIDTSIDKDTEENIRELDKTEKKG